jgi:hypothetical protein
MRQVIGLLFALAIVVSAQAPAPAQVPAAGKLEGVVTNAASDSLVEISLGSDDGVQLGMLFEVLRQGKYLGRIEILKVVSNRAVGKTLAEYRKGRVEKDDRVRLK